MVGTVGLEIFLHLSATVELVGSCKVAALHLHKDGLCIDESALVEIEVYAGAQELLGEHWDVEVVGVVAGEIATGKLFFEVGSQLLEGWCILYVFIADAGEGHYLCRYFPTRINEEVLAVFGAVWHHFDV